MCVLCMFYVCVVHMCARDLRVGAYVRVHVHECIL